MLDFDYQVGYEDRLNENTSEKFTAFFKGIISEAVVIKYPISTLANILCCKKIIRKLGIDFNREGMKQSVEAKKRSVNILDGLARVAD